MRSYAKNYRDTFTMAGRCLLLSGRNPDTILTSIMLPAMMMVLFVCLFGKVIRIEGISYVNYIVPGILLQCIGQCSATTAVSVNRDITGKMAERFCILPLKKGAILTGYVLEAFVRGMITSGIVLLAAALMGFWPSSDLSDWGIVFLLISGSILTLSWLAVITGLTASSAEGASSLSAVAIILPYLSSGFVPAEVLPPVVRTFAEYQPMTVMIDTMRNAFLGNKADLSDIALAACWCLGLCAVFSLTAGHLFKRKMAL